MRIGVVYEHVDGGGAPLVVRNQVNHLNDCGHKVTFITTPQTVDEARETFPFARAIPLLTGHKSRFLALVWPFFIVLALISFRVQLVIIHSVRTASYFGFLAALCGRRVIVVEHANPLVTRRELSNRQRRFLDFVLQRSVVVCVSHGSAQAFKETFGVEAQAIHNFVAFEDKLRTTQTGQRDNSIVFMGRLAPEKQAIAIIDCFEKIASQCDWRLEIFGDGEELESLQERAKNSKVGDRIRFGGWVSRPRSVLEWAGVFVLTSRYEGFGIALIEAMSLGAPCVSFDCPFGPREIIENGRSGILVANGNINELAEVLLRLIRNPKLREELGAAAICRSAKFSLSAHNSAWDGVIGRDCLGKVDAEDVAQIS